MIMMTGLGVVMVLSMMVNCDDSGDVDGDGAQVEPHHRKSVGRRPC